MKKGKSALSRNNYLSPPKTIISIIFILINRKISHKIKQEYETRLENKLNNQKYSNLLNDSFNNLNRSNSVRSNLSDNVSYNNQNRKMNYNLNLNLQSHEINNYQNMNQFNNFNQNNIMSNNKINPNFNQKNIINFSPNSSNAGNINYMQRPMFNIQHPNNMNIGNFHNMNLNKNSSMMSYNNSGKNIQYGRGQNNNQAQNKYGSNSITDAHHFDYNHNRLNISGNIMINQNNNKNIWGLPNQFPYQNSISPNNSIGKGSFSDNELSDNQFFNLNNSRNNFRSFSSHFSNSSSDQLNESLKCEKDYEMILGNPDEDDSIDMHEMDTSQKKTTFPNGANEQFYGKNDLYYLEKIENNNQFLKELIKEGEKNLKKDEIADTIDKKIVKEHYLNKDNFLCFLKIHKFNNLHNLIDENRIILNDLVKYSDEKIIELIEEENKPKANLLIEVLMKFDEKLEGDDVMESLNNLDFK